ncbi:MAG: hypothetical protein KH202_11430 [Clostridiales bacterium]|nr:hypothetical protein [Clostridiales bacterium]
MGKPWVQLWYAAGTDGLNRFDLYDSAVFGLYPLHCSVLISKDENKKFYPEMMICFNPNIPQFETGFNKGIKVQLHIIKSRQTEERNHWEKHVSSFADSKSIKKKTAPLKRALVYRSCCTVRKIFFRGAVSIRKDGFSKPYRGGRAAPCTREYSAEAAAGKTIT